MQPIRYLGAAELRLYAKAFIGVWRQGSFPIAGAPRCTAFLQWVFAFRAPFFESCGKSSGKSLLTVGVRLVHVFRRAAIQDKTAGRGLLKLTKQLSTYRTTRKTGQDLAISIAALDEKPPFRRTILLLDCALATMLAIRALF